MYQNSGTYYTLKHSISFGELIYEVMETDREHMYTTFVDLANTWDDWHLIPSSRLSVVNPPYIAKFVEIPGMDGALDLSTFLTGTPIFQQRKGSWSFEVDNGHEYWIDIRNKIVEALHGKRLKVRLMDDPEYFYEGTFTVGNWESGADHSKITIEYTLDPFKYLIYGQGTIDQMWDTFDFNVGHDHSHILGPYGITVSGSSKTFTIIGTEYPFTPEAIWDSGNVTVSFNGYSKTLSSEGRKSLGKSMPGENTLVVSGNGKVHIEWKAVSL